MAKQCRFLLRLINSLATQTLKLFHGTSCLINAMNPGKDVTSLINIEKGDYIDPCWNEFILDIKQNITGRNWDMKK